jgi:hypothetical protein
MERREERDQSPQGFWEIHDLVYVNGNFRGMVSTLGVIIITIVVANGRVAYTMTVNVCNNGFETRSVDIIG